MTTFATDSLFIICFNTLKHCFMVDLVAALGGIPGAFFFSPSCSIPYFSLSSPPEN